MTTRAPILGNNTLPAGFAHPHASEEARRIAEQGMILRTQVGSGVHGTAISGQDDRDEMGICLERLVALGSSRHVPDEPDRGWVNDWLHRSHAEYWQA